MGMIVFPDSALGASLFALSKVWLFAFPVLWHKLVDKQPLSLSPAEKGGMGIAAISGLLISAIIFAAYFLLGDRLIDKDFLVEKIYGVGLSTPQRYLIGATYWILVNSVLEEYVWRWFCVRQCERLMRPTFAVIFSALFFTLHHIFSLMVYFDAFAVALCSTGVFIGGAIWSTLYIKYKSIWPGYLSHALVDLCVFTIGYMMLFGN